MVEHKIYIVYHGRLKIDLYKNNTYNFYYIYISSQKIEMIFNFYEICNIYFTCDFMYIESYLWPMWKIWSFLHHMRFL
jgi:hypothetical protein